MLGNRGISLVSIGVSCFVVVAGFLWQQQISSEGVEEKQLSYQKQIGTDIQNFTLARIDSAKEQMSAIASSKQIIDALTFNDSSLIELLQQDLLSYFPNARSLCLINANVDDVSSKGCMPITFAILNSLRQAKKEGEAKLSVIKPSTPDGHILLAQSIANKSGRVVGVLVITLNNKALQSLLYSNSDFSGYVELQQGSKHLTVLAKQGNSAYKQGLPLIDAPLPNSYWRLAYWPEKVQSHSPQWFILSGVIAVMLCMWLFLELMKSYLVKRDVAIIKGQLADLKLGTLKPRYHVTLHSFNPLVADILKLGRENYHNSAKKGATAESLIKKSEEVESNIRLQAEKEIVKEIINIDPNIFRMNDIRGVVGQGLDEDVLRALGQSIGSEAIEQGINQLVVGRDARLSSPGLSKALIEGLVASGCNIIDVGEVPTPVMYFACEHFNTQSGVVLTGSHNPSDYNGLKIVLAGQSLAHEDLMKLHRRIQNDELLVGKGSLKQESISYDYVSQVVSSVKVTRPIKVVIDCGNGIAGSIAPALFKAIGCEVVELFCEVDGKFPNHHPDPSRPENLTDLAKAVQENGAEIGLAFDGDGDRLGVVDGSGKTIFPDSVLMIFAQDILSKVPRASVIFDVKSSSLLTGVISEAGGKAVMSRSGHSLIKQKMKEVDAELAGEFSGHFFIKEGWYGFDDALYAGARLLDILTNDGMSRNATEVFSALPSRESTHEILVAMAEGESDSFMRQLTGEGKFDGADLSVLDGLRAEYPHGWGLVRASNTVPGLTLRFEADSTDELYDIQQRFKAQMLQVKPTLKLLF